jgi:hypothetical protein
MDIALSRWRLLFYVDWVAPVRQRKLFSYMNLKNFNYSTIHLSTMSTLLTHLFAGRTLACVCLTILLLYFYHLYSEASVSVVEQRTQIDRLLQQQDSLRAQLQGGWRIWNFGDFNTSLIVFSHLRAQNSPGKSHWRARSERCTNENGSVQNSEIF